MAHPTVHHRLLLEAPWRFVLSVALALISALVYVFIPNLRSRPPLFVWFEFVLFLVCIGAYKLYKSGSWRSLSIRDEGLFPVPVSMMQAGRPVFERLASSEFRIQNILQLYEAQAGSNVLELRKETGMIREQWQALYRLYFDEIAHMRSAVSAEAQEKYFVLLENTPLSGALFEEVVENLGFGVRRIPASSALLYSSELMVVFVVNDKSSIVSFRQLAEEPKVAWNMFSEVLPKRAFPVGFVDSVVKLVSRVASASYSLSKFSVQGTGNKGE